MSGPFARGRRGSIYVVVISTVMVVALLGTAGVLAQTRQRERARAAHDAPRAAALARAAVELGLERIAEDPAWRAKLGGGAWYDRVAPSGDAKDGVLSLTVTGPGGGALGHGAQDPFELVGTGEFGRARRRVVLPFTAEVSMLPLPCLDVAMLSHNDLKLSFNASLLGSGTAASNNDVDANMATVTVDAQAVKSVKGATYWGSRREGAPERAMPKRDAVLDAYNEFKPVIISRADLPTDGTRHYLRRVLLSPGSNPFGPGTTHPLGIYQVEMDDEELYIEDVRIYGTLIVKKPKSTSMIRNSVSIGPAVPGFPSLIITEKDIRIRTSDAALDEAALGVNFNPVGSGVDGGEDSDTSDTYPSEIEGIFYTDKKIIFESGSRTVIRGHMMSEGDSVEIGIGAVVRLLDWDEAREEPPPGFRSGSTTSSLAIGAWARQLDE